LFLYPSHLFSSPGPPQAECDMKLPRATFRLPSLRTLTLTLMLAFVLPNGDALSRQLIFTPSHLRFGQVPVGQPETLVATLVNTQSTSVTVSTMQLNAPDFTVNQPALPFTVAPGQSIGLNITFQPSQGGPAAGDIAFDGAATHLYLHGWGVARASLIANPSSPQFANVAVGASAKLPIVLTNSGSSTITVSHYQIAGAGFSVDGLTSPLTMTPGQTYAFNITFTPKSVGAASGRLELLDATKTALIVPLAGAGVATGGSQLIITPASLAFGSVPVVSSAGSTNATFSLGGLSLPVTIPSGGSASFTVTFAPRGVGATSANLSFATDASNSPKPMSLSGAGGSLISGLPHGMFILDPPSNDNNCPGLPANCYSQHLVPTLVCTGAGTPAGYNCTREGAGEPYIKGAIFYVRWDMVNPSNGKYDFTIPDNRMRPWVDAGKLVSFDFIPTTQGSTNDVTPSWYLKPVKVSSLSQTGRIITLQTSTDMGFFPGGVSAAAGLEIQIAGTGTALDGNGTPSNPGIWTVCDHTTSGCQDPSSRTITAIGAGNDIAPIGTGTVGNPVYGSAGGPCGSGILPIEWRPNFQRAWQSVMQQVVAHYGRNNSVAYLRFGLGIGGENIPNHGTKIAACQTQMTKFGFTSVAAPWPSPSAAQWPQVSATWISYLKTMLQYEHSLSSRKAITTTISPIQTSGGDLSTPDATATTAVAEGIGFGNQGLQKSDPLNFAAGRPCYGGDWCANLNKYRGQVPLELQTLLYSDPTDVSQTGSLVNLLPFATLQGAQILELYLDDWLCTYDSSWKGNNTYSKCAAVGYPVAFMEAAGRLN
jgi:hypothetical protein